MKNALFSMHPDKALGLDGLNPAFYQHHWGSIKHDVVNQCLKIISDATLPSQLHDTAIVLILKKRNPEVVSDLRPIALCQVLYKIVAKMLANRLKLILPDLISQHQSAFVPGHLITDNIMLAFEIMHYMKRKTQGKCGVAALKIDISKAYDRMEWAFLEAILKKLGFCANFVNLLMMCVQ